MSCYATNEGQHEDRPARSTAEYSNKSHWFDSITLVFELADLLYAQTGDRMNVVILQQIFRLKVGNVLQHQKQ